MTVPTIHRNGTAKADLIEMNCDAAAAIRDAIRKLENAGPNGRDYYPQGPDAIRQAEAEHTARIKTLVRVLRELEALTEAIDLTED